MMKQRNAYKSRIGKALLGALTACVLLLPLSPARAEPDITTGLIGWWKLDETTGTTALDYASANNGTMVGGLDAAVDSVAGPVGTALNYTGSGESINLGNPSYLSNIFATGGTLTGWFWVDPSANTYRLLDKNQPAAGGYILTDYIPSGGVLRFGMDYRNAGWDTINPIPTGRWFHLAVVYDASLLVNDPQIYFDGVLQTLNEWDPPNGVVGDDSADILQIGNRNALDRALTGNIDDVRFYNRMLTPEDVAYLYESRDGNIKYDTDFRVPKFFNGDSWQSMGKKTYVPNAVEFYSAGDYLLRGGALTGVTDGKKVTASFWTRFNTAPTTTTYQVVGTNPGRFSIGYTGGGTQTMQMIVRDSAGTIHANIGCGPNPHLAGVWYHHLISVDVGTGQTSCYVNDADSIQTFTAPTDATLDFTPTELSIGANPTGTLAFDGEIADLWVDIGTYIDFSVAANRRKFIDADGNPVYLGADGSLPTGTSPDIFLSGDTATWHTNDGTGGGFTEMGALTDSATDPTLSCAPRTGPFVQEDLSGATSWMLNVWVEDPYIYGADDSAGIHAYSFDGTTLTTLATQNTPANASAITSDGTYIYVADGYDTLQAYTFDGTSFSLAASLNNGVSNLSIWTDGTYIYVGGTGGLLVYSFDGSSFTELDSDFSPDVNDVWGDGTYIYATNSGDVIAYSFDGTTLSNLATFAGSTSMDGVWADGNYVYAADSTSGVHALTFNGISFSSVGIYNTAGDASGVWGDGTNLYVADWSNGIVALRFDGSNFTLLDSLDTQEAYKIRGDGHYLYLADGGNMIAYSGFGPCQCSAPVRDEGTIIYNAASKVAQFCDGSNWKAMGPVPGAGTGGCSNPTKAEGSLIFNKDNHVMQYCDGDNWVVVGPYTSPLMTGLQSYWQLEENPVATPIADSAGSNEGTVSGSLTTTAGQKNQAVYFDGSDVYINVGPVSWMQGASKYTMAAWLKRSAAGDIIGFGQEDSTAGFVKYYNNFEFWSDGELYFQVGDDSANMAYGQYTLNDTSWHHVVMVFDGTQTGNANRLKGYVDGAQVTLTFTGTVPATTHSQPYSFYIGSGGDCNINAVGACGGGQWISGSVDDVRMYNRALSSAEVYDLYQAAQ